MSDELYGAGIRELMRDSISRIRTYEQQYPATQMEAVQMLQRGDRVRIKEGYDGAGTVGFYCGKDNYSERHVLVDTGESYGADSYLADAIEPYPYTREERIERAIEDYAEKLYELSECDIPITDDDRALMFAILDAGV